MIAPGLGPNDVLVFGSNQAGKHKKGAARDAARFWGAIAGQGEGWMGQCYALPTKDTHIQTLPLTAIEDGVGRLLEVAAANPEHRFVVTRVGCGLAGYRDEQIYPFFTTVPDNVILPGLWLRSLGRLKHHRVIVAGSRNITDYAWVDRVLSKNLTESAVIVSGGAKGVDMMGERWAKENRRRCIRFPCTDAEWNRWGKPAGMVRNKLMGTFGTALIAFWDGHSPGTQGMITFGKEQGLVVRTKLPELP